MAAPIEVRQLRFAYPEGPTILEGLDLSIDRGERCLLVGRNGAGKSTLLHLIAGRHRVGDDLIRVLGRPAFSDTSLVEEVAFLGGNFPFDVDIGVDEILARRSHADPRRRDELVRVLDVDPRWRMSTISDGQRRRVQILLGLLFPMRVLLLDEVTTDLDVLARAALFQFLEREARERNLTILYATHILEGLEGWATHIAHLDGGRIVRKQRLSQIAELEVLKQNRVASPLLRLVETWLATPSDSAKRT